MTEESAVKVCVRVRPLIAREESDAVENTEPAQLYWKADKKSIYLVDDGNSTKNFSFDRVFAADETTNHLYQDIAKPLVVSTVKGYNGTIFAYGQTSSGKTFTMMGSDHIPGVIPLAVDDVFQTIKNIPKKEFLLRVSYMEIYNETVTDLLVDSWKRKPLEVREAMNKNIYVADLTEELVTSPAQALAWIRKGEKNRHYGKTKMNQRSSRSHAIFRMILESRDRSDQDSGENTDGAIIVSHLNLVDLAGSERASQTGAEGTRFKEGCNINRSLFTLGQVIKKVTDENQNGFTNYRDSKLTRILQNSLGGNAKTVIICTVTPATIDETLSTLQFASTAKKMKNDPHVTEVSDDGALLKRYRNEIVDLKRRLHEVSSVTQTTATEKEVLSQLLQEKDQLQREQEDRIKNLTKLLVTSSNLVPVQRMPKRRVTWGGKMIRLGRPSACGVTNLSFADPFSRKRKANRSCLMELGEEDEEFESNWEIPDEPTDEMETSHSSVAVRSFEDSPKDYLSPDQRRELSGKVSSLERQLEMEILQKEEAVTKVKSLDDRVAELELQLQQKLEALDKMQTTDQTTAELELQLQQKLEALDKMQTTDQTTAELELLLQQKQEALDRMQTMDHKTAELELLLQQKQEALDRMQTTDQTTAELELLLQQKQEALDRMQTTDQKTAELELQAEAQQKQEATEKAVMLEIRVADLEKQLEEQSSAQRDTEQLKREFGETIQLCETLATEKDMVVNEREYLKQELGMFIEQTGSLEKENAALSQELEERSETEEFKSLEEEFRKEHENELKGEIYNLKKTIESFELQNQELQKNLETLSEELKKKSDFAEELQSLSGKDLVQEVATLRRSLDDAEGLSRDTKKEWALLRSQNIALEETTGTLTANHDKMAAEVNGLHYQLETEKSRFRKMQGDLQKELNVVFDENTKLTTLLDGKVPKNLMDSMELERTVANLNKELTASCEAEVALRAQVEELSSFQALPAKVDNLMEQVAELTEQLCAAESQRDGLLSTQSQCQEEAQQLGDALQVSQEEILKVQADLSAAELREKELSQQWAELRSALESSDAERNLLTATCEETRLKLEVSEQHGASLEEKLSETLQLMKDLEEKLADTESSRATEEEISKELQEQLNQMAEELKVLQAEREQFASVQSSAQETETLLSTVTSLTAERDQLKVDLQGNVQMAAETQILLQTLQDDLQEAQQKNSDSDKIIEQKDSDMRSLSQQLQCVRDEKEALLMDSVQSSAEEREQQLSAVTSLTAERDQLKLDLQENVEMMIENQEELRTALEKNRELKYLIKHLETAQTSKQDSPPSETSAQQEELQTQMKTLTEELQSVRSERDTVLSESMANSQTHGEEMEKLLCSVTSLSEERDQLLETLEGLRQEKQQLRAELEDKMEMVALAHGGFNQPELQDHSEMVAHLQQEIERLQAALQTVGEQKIQLEGDLGRNMEMATEAQTLLQSLQQQLQEQNQRNIDLESLSQERQAQLEQQVNETRSLLGSLQEELQQQKQNHSDHLKLCEPRESDLAQQTKVLTEQLESARAEREALLFEKETCPLASTEDTEKLLSRVTSLTEERDQLQETLEGLRQEKQQLRAELEDRMEMMQCEQQQQFSSEPRSLKEEQEAQRLLQMQQLEEHLEESKEELSQLKSDLQENVELMIQNQEELRMSQEKIRNLQEEVDMLRSHKAELESRTSSGRDMENTLQSQELQNQIQRLTEELKVAHSEKESLLLDVRADSQTLSGEIEKLECRVGSLTEERDQLQETLEELRQEKQQLRAENEERMETLQTEVRQLSTSLHTVNEQKRQLEEDLQQKMNMVSTTQELLKSVEEELHQQKQVKSDLETLSQQKESSSEQEIRNLAETLERSKAERDSLLLEKETNCQSSTEEMEKLLSRVTALTEERDRLQETLEELRQEKQQLGAETEDRMETLQTEILTLAEKLERIEAERDVLLSERESSYHASTEEMEKLLSRVTTLSEERDRLQEKLETLRQEEQQLRAELEDGMETLQTEILSLTETLNGVEAQRDGLLSEREAGHQTSTEEMEKLLSRVASLGEEKTRLQEALEGLREEKQEALEGLREEKQQLGAQLETRMEMMSAMQERLSEQELNMHQQAERGEREAKLQQELLSEANSTISALREQQGTSGVKKMASAQLQDSAAKFQELLEKFQHFIDTCSKYEPTVLAKAQRSSINLVSLPKPTAESYVESCEVGLQTVQCLNNILVHLQVHAQFSRNVFKELVKEDLALFEEKRLQDVLLCRVEAPSFSVKDGDFHSQWEHRLTEVLDKRQLYQQKMVCILEKLWANIAHFPSELLVEVREKERFKEHVQAALATQSVDYSGLDSILSRELERRTALLQSMKTTLKGVVDEHNGEVQELKQLEAQTYSQLREERSKNATLLQALEGAPLKTELSLLKDNQQLVLKVQQTEEEVKALRGQIGKLEDAQVKANNRVSNHKEATQLLQTELQDSRAQVEDKDSTIQTLRSKLRESEKNASPSAVEMEKLRSKVFKMEMELSSASDKHQQEIHRLSTLLSEKEDSLRKLKETLRKSQQQGEESFLQGEDLHARLTNPRGWKIKSSIGLEKTKLEEEVQKLQLKITELESLVSSQQAEIGKWKSRAIKLKVKKEMDKPSPPCTPIKRGLPMTSDSSNLFSSPKKFVVTPKKVLDSPRKVLDSPKKVLVSPKKNPLLDSPKSRFFDVGGSSDLLSRTCPKQFFDNSSLGTIPEVSNVPVSPDDDDEEEDDSVGAHRKEEWWPQSPKQDDMCKQQ